MANVDNKLLSSEGSPFDVTINVEGRLFNTTETVLKSIPDSLLASVDKYSRYFHSASDAYCFDRDSNLFPSILAAHRDGVLHVPHDVCPLRFRKEMEFWKIPKCLIAPCCWRNFYSVQDDLEIIHKITETLPKKSTIGPKKILRILDEKENPDEILGENENDVDLEKDENSLCHRIWLFLDEPRSSMAAKVWSFIYVFVVIVSVILNMIWLDSRVRVEPYLVPFKVTGNITFNDKVRRLLLTDPHIVLLSMDCFCTIFFTADVIIHFATCPIKTRFLHDYLRSVKVIVTFSMLFSTVFEFRKDWLTTNELRFTWFFIKSLNTLRVLLVTKFTKLSSTWNVVFLTFYSCQREIYLLLLILLFTIVIYGGLIFAFEMNSDMFPDTGRSMWWALITMTTIGYGDFHPTQPMGYVVGTLCAIEGIMMIALPIAVVASQFSKYKDRNEDVQKHLEDVAEESKRNTDYEINSGTEASDTE